MLEEHLLNYNTSEARDMGMASQPLYHNDQDVEQFVDPIGDNITGYERSNMTTPMQYYPMALSYEVIRVVWIISIFGNTLGAMSIVLNITFLIWMRTLKDKATVYHPFMQNLSLSDILASLTFLVTQNWPRGPFAYIEPFKEFMLVQGLPYLFRSTPWMFFTGYLLTLTCLSVNQFVAVCRPWKYSELLSKRFVCLSLMLVWSISCLQIVVPLIVLLVLWGQDNKTQATATLFRVSGIEIQVWMTVFAASTLVNIWLNVLVYCKIRQLKFQRRQPSNNTGMLNIRMKQEAFVTVSLLLGASIFCRLPFPLMGLIGINLQRLLSPGTARIVNATVVLLLYVNFFVDPIIYVFRMKEVRRSYVAAFDSCLRCCRKTSYVSRYGASLRLLTSRVAETASFNRRGTTNSSTSSQRSASGMPADNHRYVHVHADSTTPETAI